MDELLRQSVPLAIAVFLATAMLSVGLDLTVRQVVEPLRRGRLVRWWPRCWWWLWTAFCTARRVQPPQAESAPQ